MKNKWNQYETWVYIRPLFLLYCQDLGAEDTIAKKIKVS